MRRRIRWCWSAEGRGCWEFRAVRLMVSNEGQTTGPGTEAALTLALTTTMYIDKPQPSGHIHKRIRTCKNGRESTLWYVVVDLPRRIAPTRHRPWPDPPPRRSTSYPLRWKAPRRATLAISHARLLSGFELLPPNTCNDGRGRAPKGAK